jgi:hypothetical protein
MTSPLACHTDKGMTRPPRTQGGISACLTAPEAAILSAWG